MCTPIKISRAERRALREIERRRRDAIDHAAEREGLAVEQFADDTETQPPVQGYIRVGLQISTALALHELFPLRYPNPLETHSAKSLGHFQKQNAHRAHERVTAGGEGKREIVTRADKVRRAINAAARRLDVLAAESAGADPVTVQAIAIANTLLRRTVFQ